MCLGVANEQMRENGKGMKSRQDPREVMGKKGRRKKGRKGGGDEKGKGGGRNMTARGRK